MAVVTVRLLSIVIIVFGNLIFSFLAAKNYRIILTNIQCKHNKKYASNSSCILNGATSAATGASFEMQMKAAVKDYRIDLSFFLDRKKKFLSIFKAPNLKACEEFTKNQTNMYLQLFKEMTDNAGTWPNCPIDADFHFKFHNITPNLNYLPPYLPPVTFKFLVTLKDKMEVFLDCSIIGRIIVQKSALKGKPKN